MPRKRPPSDGERNITIALTDSELELLTRLGRDSRTEFVDYVCRHPEEIKGMGQAELEAMVKKAAPLDARELARMIIVEWLRLRGALPSNVETPSFLGGIMAGAAFYSGPLTPAANEKRTSITVPLSRAERAALNKVAAEVEATLSGGRAGPSILARLGIMIIAQRFEAFINESKAARELAAGGTSHAPARSADPKPDDA
jgi:hypothetical protein